MIKIQAVGRLTKDPTFTQTNSGIDLSRFTLACKSKIKDEEGYKSNFLNVVAWRTHAENIMQFCKKGDLVAITGNLESRFYESENGGKQLVWEVNIEDIEYLTTKADREKNGGEVTSKSKPQKFEEVDDDNLPF